LISCPFNHPQLFRQLTVLYVIVEWKEMFGRSSHVFECFFLLDSVDHDDLRYLCFNSKRGNTMSKLNIEDLMDIPFQVTWLWTDKFHLESKDISLVWSSPDYNGDNSIEVVVGYGAYLKLIDVAFGRDKGIKTLHQISKPYGPVHWKENHVE